MGSSLILKYLLDLKINGEFTDLRICSLCFQQGYYSLPEYRTHIIVGNLGYITGIKIQSL